MLMLTLIGMAALAVSRPAVPAGSFICRVEQKAGINTTHLLVDGGPATFVDTEVPVGFSLSIKSDPNERNVWRLTETPYAGPDRSRLELEDDNSVLHATYIGDGRHFRDAATDAFFDVGLFDRQTGEFTFTHAGYEHPGGEDTNFAVRSGRCRPAAG